MCANINQCLLKIKLIFKRHWFMFAHTFFSFSFHINAFMSLNGARRRGRTHTISLNDVNKVLSEKGMIIQQVERRAR